MAEDDGRPASSRAEDDGRPASSRAEHDGHSASSRAEHDGHSASSRAEHDGHSASSRAEHDGHSASSRAEAKWYDADIERVVVTEDQIRYKIEQLAKQIAADYHGVGSVLLVGVLKGAFVFMADFARALARHARPAEVEFMAVSSYGQRATSSGVVRILKDLDREIAGRHVLVIEDIVDSGVTLSWLVQYLQGRAAASGEVVAVLRTPGAVKVAVAVGCVGCDIPSEFVVGYGLDFAGRYRELPYIGVLRPAVCSRV